MTLKIEIDESLLEYVAAAKGWNGLSSDAIVAKLNDVLVDNVRELVFLGKTIKEAQDKTAQVKSDIELKVVKA